MKISKKWEKRLEVLPPGTLCPKISFLAQELRAVAREQTHTHTHTHRENLEAPFFCNYFFILIRFRMRIRSTCKNKGSLKLSYSMSIFFKVAQIKYHPDTGRRVSAKQGERHLASCAELAKAESEDHRTGRVGGRVIEQIQ